MDWASVRITLSAIFLFVGTAGIILSVITVTNKHCKKSSYTVYLAALAVVDLLALYTTIIRINSPHDTFGINPTTASSVFCKLHLFLEGLFTGVSIWLIVILALERTFVVYFPFKAKSVCKLRTAFITTAFLVVFFSAYNSHFLYGMKLQSVISPDDDLLKPSIDLNAPTNFGSNENATKPPFKETVSSCLNDSNNNETTTTITNNNIINDDNSSIIDGISGLNARKEITTNDAMVMGMEHDATDHPLAINCNPTEPKSGNTNYLCHDFHSSQNTSYQPK